MSIQNYRVVEQNKQQVEEVEQAPHTLHDSATQESHITQQDEAPPKTGSKQWKALYESIANYAKDVRSNKA